jgi:hypothetical protein
MKNNKAITTVVKSYLKDLTAKEIIELLPDGGKAKSELLIKRDDRCGGDFRLVKLSDINSQSEFDEFMETFRAVHPLTELTATN